MKIVIIGGGVSGLFAAHLLERQNDVTIIEKNKELGKKILMTGNGHCNYWHDNLQVSDYHTDNQALLKTILANQKDCLAYLTNSMYIYPFIKDHYYYPYNREARSIRDTLVNSLKKTDIILNGEVRKIVMNGNKFIVYYNQEKIIADKVILSTGSYAFNVDNNGYRLLSSWPIKINHVLPALCKIEVKENINSLTGIRFNAQLFLYINKRLVQKEEGEIQFNKNCLSGICVFNLASNINRALYHKDDVEIKINYFPEIKKVLVNDNVPLNILLGTIFPRKLLLYFFNILHLDGNLCYQELDLKMRNSLIKMITNSIYLPKLDNNMECQVCTGGVSLKEVNDKLEVNKVPNLYLLGEMLDVDGKCGGYNIAFALLSAYQLYRRFYD